jgi:hypothetical protein
MRRRTRTPVPGTQLVLTGLLVAALFAGSAAAQDIAVPRAGPIVVDGQLGEAAWQNGVSFPLAPGGEVRFVHDGSALYVGVRVPNGLLFHLCLASGDTVRVLHSSAAIGHATFSRDGTDWSRVADFAWALRGNQPADSIAVARQAHLGSQGWVANAQGGPQPAVTEFALDLARLGAGPRIGLAVAVATNPLSPLVWPDSVQDGCGEAPLLFGTAPPRASFTPRSWWPITLR